MNNLLKLYLIRHGRTEWNEQGLLQGAKNSPLIAQGIEGAKRTGQALQHIPFTAVYTSQLQRTIDTANYIINDPNVPMYQLAELNEQDFGSWEGQAIEQLRQTEEFHNLQHNPTAYQASNGGETYQQLAHRLEQGLNKIIQAHQQGNILIVSHGHSLRLLLALLQNIPWQQHRNSELVPSLANTAITIVKYPQQGSKQAEIELLNSKDHLL